MKKQILAVVSVSMVISQLAWASVSSGLTGETKMRDLDAGSFKCEFHKGVKNLASSSSSSIESSRVSDGSSKSGVAR
ncbi:MAG: hypothetical protein ACO3A2_06150 [Bdellovibrionia bacterium]